MCAQCGIIVIWIHIKDFGHNNHSWLDIFNQKSLWEWRHVQNFGNLLQNDRRSPGGKWILQPLLLLTHWPLMTPKHDDVIKWKHFPRYWPFVRGIHRSPVNSPHKGQWRGALMFTLICARINDWVNNRKAGDLRRYRTHYDVIVMGTQNDTCWIEETREHASATRQQGKLQIISELLHELETSFEIGTPKSQRHLSPPITVASVLTTRPWPVRQNGLAAAKLFHTDRQVLSHCLNHYVRNKVL